MATRLRRILAPWVLLAAADADGDEPRPIWIQAATEGIYKGHPANPKIELTREAFEEVIANFRANPSYKAGPDGIGTSPVVRLDYEHISEMHPLEVADAPAQGIPAPGWIQDLELRDGEGANEGLLELWALVLPNATLWSQIQNKEQIWTSVAINPKSKHRVTGKGIGNELTSLAITNNPFILGMAPMSTDSIESKPARLCGARGALILEEGRGRGRRPELITCAMDMWGEAETPEEALVGLRNRFGLRPEATATDVLAEVLALEQMLAEDKVPEDAQHIVSQIRSLLGMKVLATRAEVLAAAKAVLAPLVEIESAGGGTDSPVPQAPPTATDSSTENTTMSAKTLAARLAPTLKLSADASEDDVFAAVIALTTAANALKARKSKLAKRLKLTDTEDEEQLLEAMDGALDGAAEGEEAKNAIEKLLELLGGEDLTDVLAKATKLTEDASKYSETIAALNEMRAKLTDAEVKEAEDEVAAIAASHKLSDKNRAFFLSIIVETEKDAAGKETKRVNQKQLLALRENYPLRQGETVRSVLLTANLLAGPNGTQLGGTATGLGSAAPAVPRDSESRGDLKTTQEKILACAGRNNTEKAMSYLEEHEPAKFGAVADSDKPRVAGHFFRTGTFRVA